MRTALALLAVLAGCAEPPPPEPTPEPACAVAGQLRHAGEPVAAAALTATGSRQVDERRWTGVGRFEATTDGDGNFAGELPCGSRLELVVPGWNPASTDEVWLEPGMAPLAVDLVSAVVIDLVVLGPDGARVAATLERPGGDVAIAPDGTELYGLIPGQVAGTVRAEGLPPRRWVPARSEVVEAEHKGHLLTSLRLGPTDLRWVVPPPGVRGLEGWCVDGGARGERCQQRPGSLKCLCPGGRVAVRAPGWDVAAVVEVVKAELSLDPLPATRTLCIDGAPTALTVGPEGLPPDLVLGSLASKQGDAACVVAPADQPLVASAEGQTWAIPAGVERFALSP